ncbi:MAG: cation-translocating P-type ATPase [Simkaniaceae bacterium]
MRKSSLKVAGLHCSSEITLLKKTLLKEKGVESIEFDLLKEKMIITHDEEILSLKMIIEKIRPTGMRAFPWEERDRLSEKERRYKKAKNLFIFLSGISLFIGLLIQLRDQGSFIELFGSFSESEKLPLSIGAVVCYLFVIFFGGFFLFPKAIKALKTLRFDMNLLMLMALIGALFLGEWFEGAMLVFLFSVANTLEEWSVGRARRSIQALLTATPQTATLILKDHKKEIPVEEVPLNSLVEVKPGEKIPLDGEVVDGTSSVNQAPITGESSLVLKEAGSEVFAGTINEEGPLVIRTTKEAGDTKIAKILRLIEKSSETKAPKEEWVMRFSRIYTPIMMAISVSIALFPPLFLGGDFASWFYRALVVLVVACPCALVISTPVSIVSALTLAARQGLLIKGGRYLEIAASLKVMAFDKTGTLTNGKMSLESILPMGDIQEEEILQIAASLESSSNHPIAVAILKKYGKSSHLQVADYTLIKGKGAEGTIQGTRYFIGSHRFLHEKNIETESIHEKANALEDAGHTVLALGTSEKVIALLSLSDTLRKDVKETLAALREGGVKEIMMLTGDNVKTAQSIAEAVGIEKYLAELLPEDKVEAIHHLRERSNGIAMVGDGINDAPAMAASDLGIAMGAIGTDVAIETADIALMSDDLSKLPFLLRHAKRAMKIIKQNITFSLSLKFIFLILAILGFASIWMAIAADTGATLLVIFNGLRLLHR